MITYFILGALILEIVTFNVLNLGVVPSYFLLNLAIIFIIGMIIYVIPNFTVQYVIYTIILLVQTVFIYVNYTLNAIFGDLFSFDMLGLMSEAGNAFSSDYIYVFLILQLMAVFLAIAIVGAIFLHNVKKNKINLKQHYSIFSIILLIGIQCFSCGYYLYERNYINNLSNIKDESYVLSDSFLMNTSFLKADSYQRFGTYGYFLNSFINTYINKYDDAIEKATIEYFSSEDAIYNSSDVFGLDKGNNVIVFMMESLEWFAFGDGKYDPTLNNLTPNLTPNIYSIMFGEDYLTDTDNNNSDNDSLIMNNFFAKAKTNISEGYGIMGSYPVAQSLTRIVANSNEEEASSTLGYALPNVLKQLGYTTNYVHSNYISFYDRDKTHKYWGFDNVIGKDLIKDENGELRYTDKDLNWDHWAPEQDYINYAMNYVVPETENDSPFYTFYLNVSSHGEFKPATNTDDGDALRYYNYLKYGKDNCNIVLEDGSIVTDEELQAKKQQAKEETGYAVVPYVYKLKEGVEENETNYSEWYKNVISQVNENNMLKDNEKLAECEGVIYYQCGVMGLDEAVGDVLKELKARGIEDKTTILLYSDHYSYMNNLSQNFKGLVEADHIIETNTIPFIISSPGLKREGYDILEYGKEKVNSRFCSAYDIVPTIFDLLGVEFNQNLYIGHSLFSPAEYTYQAVNSQGEEETRELFVYYSNLGGLFSSDIYAYDLHTFIVPDEKLRAEVEDKFMSEATKVLTKLNYLHILNNRHLYPKLTLN